MGTPSPCHFLDMRESISTTLKNYDRVNLPSIIIGAERRIGGLSLKRKGHIETAPVGFSGFQAVNPVSYCMGGTSLFYFTTFICVNTAIFYFKMGLFLLLCADCHQRPSPYSYAQLYSPSYRSYGPSLTNGKK